VAVVWGRQQDEISGTRHCRPQLQIYPSFRKQSYKQGGDPCVGLTTIEAVKLFEQDKDTKALVLVGEIGGDAEERAAAYIKKNYDLPVVGFIAGRTAPPGKRMGHAGAIISGSSGTAAAKIKAMNDAGIAVAEKPSDVARLLKENM